MAEDKPLRLSDFYGPLNGARLTAVDRLGEKDRLLLEKGLKAESFPVMGFVPFMLAGGRVAFISTPQPGLIAFSARDGFRFTRFGVWSPVIDETAQQTAQVLASLPENAQPVLLNIITGDVLTANQDAVREMVQAAKPFLESRNIYLRFGKVVEGQFKVDETRAPLNTASETLAGRQGILESYIGAEDSLNKLTIPVSAGIAIVERKAGQIVRLLDTFVKTASIRRTDDPLLIKQEIVSLVADPAQVDQASNRLIYLHNVPDTINDPSQKSDILASLRPFTVIVLNFNVEQMLTYVRLATRAVGVMA